MGKKRCLKCNKKIKSILPLQCKCKNYYCNMHKIASEHDCSFNYLKENQERLEKNNEKIISNKLESMAPGLYQ